MVTRMRLDVTFHINGLSCYCLKTIKTDKTGFFLSAVLFSYLNENNRQVTLCGNKLKCVFYIALIAWIVKVHANCSLKEKCNVLLISI
jgi:hypothetical protein